MVAVSLIAKVNYDYAEKYLIELVGRRDGNSKFADGYRFQNYGSFSLGWVFTQENFIKPVSSFIGLDFGKVRLSYGSSGNDAGLGDYDYVSTVNQGTTILGKRAANVHVSLPVRPNDRYLSIIYPDLKFRAPLMPRIFLCF